ncbi:MAG TPA: ribosomal-processing cysteine protease Prp [Clostridia bacterium]|nr:ribosomal-processing cysteine protease Prp [Clostridia bacterium]
MTEITVFYRNEYVCGFVLDGHTGYNKRGKDIVCAGLSALAITAANSLEKIAKASCNLDSNDDGHFSLMLKDNSEQDMVTQTIMKYAVLGFESISKEYPEFVKITNRRCEK